MRGPFCLRTSRLVRRVNLERVKGIEPSYSAWKAAALPLSYTRGTSRAAANRREDCHKDCANLARPRRWWERQDSNLRRHSQRIYSPPPLPLGTLSHRENSPRCTGLTRIEMKTSVRAGFMRRGRRGVNRNDDFCPRRGTPTVWWVRSGNYRFSQPSGGHCLAFAPICREAQRTETGGEQRQAAGIGVACNSELKLAMPPPPNVSVTTCVSE